VGVGLWVAIGPLPPIILLSVIGPLTSITELVGWAAGVPWFPPAIIVAVGWGKTFPPRDPRDLWAFTAIGLPERLEE